MEARSCPVCRLPLEERSLADVSVECCAGCGGTWFDAHELERVRQARSQARRPVPTIALPTGRPSDGPCPACAQSVLEVVEVDGASLLRCQRCRGLFVGAETLRAMRAGWRRRSRPKRSAPPPPPPPPPPRAAGDTERADPDWFLIGALLGLLRTGPARGREGS